MEGYYKPRKGKVRDFSVFERIISIELLRQGFERVRRNNGAAGGDGVTCGVYAIGLSMRLEKLHRNLARRRYRPGPVAVFEIPKPGRAEKRVLRVPCVADRIVQSAALIVLQEILEPEFEPFSFAYRPQRSVRQALDAVKLAHNEGYSWVVDADLKSFFDEVPHLGLLGALSDYVPERRFLDLVGQWLDLSAVPGRGLPQGAPLSPILANMYLDSLDEHLDEAGFRMVRYADDFVLLCRSRKRAEAAIATAEKKLSELGLAFHPDKTRIRSLTEGYAFLGETISAESLFAQTLELADIPGGVDDFEPAGKGELSGALNLPASRRVMQREISSEGKIAEQEVALLDVPWKQPRKNAQDKDGNGSELPPPGGDAEEQDRHAPFIRPLYVTEKGRRIDAHQHGFAVFDGALMVALVPAGGIDKIEVFRGVDITGDALRLAAALGIPVFMLDGRGATQAVLSPESFSRAKLHAGQARVSASNEESVSLARLFIAGRIYNERRLLQRLTSRRPKADRPVLVEKAIHDLDYARRRVEAHPDIRSVSDVMAIEANAARVYWPALSLLLRRGFSEGQFRRERRPASSPFNAVLNFTAWLLQRDVETLVSRRGLHPGFGVLHAVNDQRAALVFDLMEELRAPVAEAVAALSLSTGALGQDDFVDVEGDIHILSDGQRALIRLYERHVDNRVRLADAGYATNWRGVMNFQISQYISFVEHGAVYRPYRMDM